MIDGDADLADFAAGLRRVGVVAELRRQVEGDRKAGRSAGQEVAVPGVGLGGRREAGVLTHGPEPATVAVGSYLAGVGRSFAVTCTLQGLAGALRSPDEA